MEFTLGDILMLTILCTIWFFIGWNSQKLVPYIPQDGINCLNNFQGLWMPDMVDGDNWICINIEGLDVEKIQEICNHEVGHEIYDRNSLLWDRIDSEEFAEMCQKNWSKCLE